MKADFEMLAAGLAAGYSYARVADQTGVSATIVRKWAHHPKVRARVRQLRGDMLRMAMGRGCRHLDKAMADAIALSENCTRDQATRLQAIRLVIDVAIEMHKDDVQDQLNELQKQIDALKAASARPLNETWPEGIDATVDASE